MKTNKLLLATAVSGVMLSGCIDLSSDDKEQLKAFLDGYAEEQDEEISTSDAREKDYLGTDVSDSDAQGSARIGGEVAVSTLEERSGGLTSISSRMQSRAVDTLTAANFKVFYINGKGQKVELSSANFNVLINYPSTGEPQYIIEGLGDGINYIVKVTVTVDGEGIDLQSVAFIPKGASKSPKAVIDPVSTVVAEAVQEKVVDGFFATGGDTFSQDYIGDLKETMTAAIKEVITSNPELSIDDFIAAIDTEEGTNNLVSKLLADETVSGEVDKLESVAVEEKFEAPDTISDAQQARDYMGRLFNQLFGDDPSEGGEGGGAPQFFIDFFGDEYFAGSERTIGQIMSALSTGLTPEGGVTPFGSTEQAAALAAFKGDLSDIYTTLDAIATLEAKATLTEAEKETLFNNRRQIAEIPQMILGIFPPNESATVASFDTASVLSVPQAITLVFYVLDVYMDHDDNSGGDGGAGGEGGDDFDPFQLLTLYGFDFATDGATYSSIGVNWLGVHPGRMWISDGMGGGQDVNVLNVFTCVEAFPFEDDLGNPVYDVSSVVLTYPTANGTATLNLVDESTYNQEGGGDPFGSCWVWDTWREQETLMQSGNYGNEIDGYQWDALATALFDGGKIVSDFTSGTYSIAVTYTKDGVTSTDSFPFTKKVITGLQQLNPRLTTPASEPRYPEGNVSQAEWEAFELEMSQFTPTTFPEGAIGTFRWNAPADLATSLPEGVIAAYSMDIGREVCPEVMTEGSYCEWQHIFSTWENNTQIFKTEFELPKYVKEQLTVIDPGSEPYSVNLGINFIDAETGEYLGQGGWSHARFYVGTPIDPTDTFTLSGSVSNVPNSDFTDGDGVAYPLSAYKVALMEESCNETSCTKEVVLNAAVTQGDNGFVYSLTPSFAEAKGTPGSWLNVFMYIDANGNGQFDEPTEANNFEGEPGFWAYDHVNFNTWGGILRLGYSDCNPDTGECNYFEQAVVPDGVYEGPSFDTMPQGSTGTAGEPL